MAELPSVDELRAWLRARVPPPRGGPLSMFLGLRRRFRYRVKPPALYRDQPFRAHRLFSVVGEAGLLPIAYRDAGYYLSWGLFAIGPDGLTMLEPGTDSLTRLLRADGRGLDAYDPPTLITLILRFGLAPERSANRAHKLVRDADELPALEWGDPAGFQFKIDADELARVRAEIIAPTVTVSPETDAAPYRVAAGGWTIRFTTLYGHLERTCELGVETVHVASDFTLTRAPRRTLSAEICGAQAQIFVISNPRFPSVSADYWKPDD